MENDFDPRDFIDSDEGYRDTDWDSHLRSEEPFYAEALPCESCGRPVLGERKPAKWDESLLIGPCCEFSLDFEFPDLPTCERLWKALDHCQSVQAVRLAMACHLAQCPVCRKAGLREAA